jgi:hypothetical protein
MTTLVLNYSTNLLESILKTLKGILASIMIGWQNARQRSANRECAIQMLRMAKSDYPYHNVDSLTAELNDKMGLK